jgi:hypothetical protein
VSFRAASTESDNPPDSSLRSKPLARNATGLQKKGSLYRKSLSLEQTSGQDQVQYKYFVITWNQDSSVSKVTGLQAVWPGFDSQQGQDIKTDSGCHPVSWIP